MSIKDLTRRVIAYWWIVIATSVAFTLFFFPWSNETQFVGTITLGINFNNPELSSLDSSSQAYVESFESLSLYMEQRFSAIDIQSIIVREGNLGISSLSNGNPFYDIENQTSGFVNLAYSSTNADQSTRFIQGAKVAYVRVIEEWNEQRQSEFRATPMTSFVEGVIELQRPIQFQLLPVISGLLVGVLLIMVLPDPKKKSKMDKKSKQTSN